MWLFDPQSRQLAELVSLSRSWFILEVALGLSILFM